MSPAALGAQLTVHARVPANTPPNAEVHIAGSFNGWNPGDSAYRLCATNGEYVITLPQTVRGRIEFKFTLGSWTYVETTAIGADIDNRSTVIPDTGAATYTGDVAAWRDPAHPYVKPSTRTSSVTILSDSFPMATLGRTRRIWLYLPPDYKTSSKRYPVIYMTDGQNVFDNATSNAGEWGVDESLDSLFALGDYGAIVVAVDNGDHRTDEYSPWKNANMGGGQGGAYADFVARTLKPYIDAHYRTRADPANTAVMGSSLGGLISLYMVLGYPDVFGKGGMFSTSIWFAPQLYAMARHAKPRRYERYYFVVGGLEGDDHTVQVNDQRSMVDTLTAAGYRVGTTLQAFVRPDGKHAEWFWRREFPAAYLWLFGSQHP